MKHSIRVKFTMIFIGLMAAVLVSIRAMNSLFLEGFYAKQELRLLENAYENLNVIAVDKEFQDQNVTEELQSLFSSDGEQTEANRLLQPISDKYDATIVIRGSITGELIPLVKDGKFLADALHHYILEIIDPGTETLISQDDHQVQKIYDRRLQGYCLQSWGFSNGNRTMFIMSVLLASIHDSVNISNEFLAYVGLAALVLGGALVYYIIKKMVSPIRSLVALSARMSELGFGARYTGDSEDEIGVLGHSMNTLSEKLRETISELKAANNELQKGIGEKIKIDKTRREFVANVSHELETPIALIRGYAEGLTEGMAEDEDSRNYYCEVIADEANKMNKMMKQLLTLTTLEFGSDMPVMERFDITAPIHGILLSIGILLRQEEARVVFGREEPVWVWADEFKIEGIVTNYLNNAMNHLGGERWIEIRLERKGKEARITVFSTGCHIPKEGLGNLWIKFCRVDKARTGEYGGDGIGFFTVRATMDPRSKSCGVENISGGVEFWFTVNSGM